MDWPAQERPREKLLHLGPDSLSDAELLAIFLRTGVKGMDAVSLARQLLKEFGSLKALLTASHTAFCAHTGLGDAKFAQLQAVLEMSRRYLFEESRAASVIDSPDSCYRYLQSQLKHQKQEVFAAVFLDNRHRVLAFESLFTGTINASQVHPRIVVQRALHHNAAALIVAHNHPSGVAEPSASDERITRTLVDALALIDVRLLDHLIIGDGEPVSLAARGLC